MKDKSIQASGIQGLNKDSTFQTPNQITFALNAIRDSHDGGKPEYQSEPGNEPVESGPSGYILLGHIYGQNNEEYLFYHSDSLTLDEIGKFKEGKYTTLVNADLGFSTLYPITGEFRIRNGCDRVIYWSDHYNPDRWFNEDKPEDFQTTGTFDPNKFKLLPTVLPPSIDINQVNNSGGSLLLGSYYFQLEVLDNSDNVIYVSDITPQTPIYDETLNAPYYTIDGGLNTPQYDIGIGGVPITSKSITLTFSNLNTSFDNLRVNVFSSTNGVGTFTGHSVGTLIPIINDTITWTYTGYNPSAGDFPIDVSEKLIENSGYESSYVQEQVQNKLVRANLKQSTRDYSTYQQFASLIEAKWVAKEVKTDDNTVIGNPKNPNTYWYGRGFQGDEVYLPGIRYLHDDGTWSPVMPLIGREATLTDLELLTVVPNNAILGGTDVWLSDVNHLDLNIGDTVERWKVFNTASIINSNIGAHPYDYDGDFSYYELDSTYPDIRDCEDSFIWGPGITDETKVRLFKFPDRRLVPHLDYSGEYILPFGIKFDNIIYPSADVIGHQFMFADRSNSQDKTVLDSGWMVKPVTANTLDGDTILVDGYEFHSNDTNEYVRYNSANSLFKKELFNFDHYKLNRVYYLQSQVVPNPSFFTNTTLTGGDIVQTFIAYMNVTDSANPLRTNHEEIKSVRVDAGTVLGGITDFLRIESNEHFTDDTFSKLVYPLENTTGLLLPQATRLTQDDTDIQINLHNFYVYKKANVQPYTNFLFRQFKYINHNATYSTLVADNEYYGGDILISESTKFRERFEASDETTYVYTIPFYQDHYEEHEINTALRHEGTESTYFKIGKSDDYVVNKLSDGDELYHPNNIKKEYYAVNPDYDVRSLERSKLPLPNNFDYCFNCVGNFPHRIIFSPKSFDEELFDLYRITNTNDYIDLPGHTGAITGLSYRNNQLLVHTENSTYILQPNPQQIQTDQNTAYLGTGDFLSVPPIELVPVNIGYAGCQSKQHQVDTPFGHCWIDQKRGGLFKFDSKLENLTEGLEQWLREFLPSELQRDYYQIYEKPYPIQVTTHKDGIGCILYYDPRFKRLIITKQEFQPIQLFDYKGFPSNSTQTTYENRWIASLSTLPVTYGDPVYFINKSWTLSYGFEYNSGDVKPFISWHSYRPYQGFNDNNNYYILNRFSNAIYRHKHKESYQRFFGTKYDFIIEYQAFDLSTDRLDTIHYVGYTYQWDPSNEDWLIQNKTFDRLLCYNNNQTTGLQTLILPSNPYQNVFLNNTSKYVIKTDQNYKIAGLMDLATGSPVMTKNWTLLQAYPSYIDRVPNTSVIDTTKSIYTQGKLWDKFVNVRLFFKPNEDYKKVIILSSINEQQSVR